MDWTGLDRDWTALGLDLPGLYRIGFHWTGTRLGLDWECNDWTELDWSRSASDRHCIGFGNRAGLFVLGKWDEL